jgi:hypothetical protein
MRCDELEPIAVTAVNIPELGIADADGLLQHGCKHRLKIAWRAADGLEHLRGRGLLLQRLGEVGCALTQLTQEPRVLDGDDSLGGESRGQLDLLFL